MEQDYFKLLDLSCTFLKYGGLSITKNTIILRIYAIVVIISSTSLLVCIIIEVIWNYKGLDTLADALNMICPTCLLVFQLFLYAIHFPMIPHLYASIRTDLWPIGKFGEELRKKQQAIIDKAVKWLKLIFTLALSNFIVLQIKPLYLQTPLIPCYLVIDISKPRNYFLIYTWQFIHLYIHIVALTAFSIQFYTTIAYLITQLAMLKHAFRMLYSESVSNAGDEAKCYEKLKEYVDYHNQLLKFLNDLQDTYFLQLLLIFLTVTIAICIQIYNIANTGFTDLIKSTNSFLFVAGYMLICFLWCFSGSEMTKAFEVADAIYDSGWEGKSRRFQTATSIIILQSQKPRVLSGGGVFALNLNSFTKVINMSYSIFTLVNSFKAKDL